MPRTNQGIFKKIRNEFKSLKAAYEQVIKKYFPDEEWNCDYDFLTDFAYGADELYTNANSLANTISGMLNATKFEEAEKEKDFKEMLSDTQDIAFDLKRRFDDTLHLFFQNGGLSEIERETLEKFQIYTKNYY